MHRHSVTRTPYRLALVAAVLGVTAFAGPAVINQGFPTGEDRPAGRKVKLAGLPADSPTEGLVYGDLRPAAAQSLCAGAYELDEQTCTHGPELTPSGLKVDRAVVPVTGKADAPEAPRPEEAAVPRDAEIVRDEGGSSLVAGKPALLPDAAPGAADFVMGGHDVACQGDGREGRRVQVVYAHEATQDSRFALFIGSIRVWAAGVDAIYDASAADTGGSRHIRYVTTPTCRVDVAEVELPAGGLSSFPRTIAALRTLGYNRTDRKYLLFADSAVYCGISTHVPDTRAGRGNRNNAGPSYARVDSGCWSTAMAAHQLTHALGASLRNSPNSTGAGSCTDDHDLLCGPDRSGEKVRPVCVKKYETRLDCGHDDYFSTDPPPGSYLAKNWNVAQSEFLLRGDGGTEDAPGDVQAPAETPLEPDPPAAKPTPETPPAPPAPPAPAVQAPIGGAPAPGDPKAPAPPAAPPAPRPGDAKKEPEPVQAVLEVRDPASNGVRLLWSEAAPGTRYTVAVDGVPIATTTATRARLIGLRPDTRYQVTVVSLKHRYRAKAAAETVPAAQPTANAWFVLQNSLTSGAADLYGARTADGTPLTLGGTDGDAQQQWKLIPAADGTSFLLRSRASGKCAVPLGGKAVAGAPLVQGDCADGDINGRWSLQLSEYGFTLRSAVGGLVAGAGGQQFGAQRVLVLQNADGSRHQSWTAVPG